MCVRAGTLVEVNEINGMRREDHLTEKYSSEVKIQHEVKSQNKGVKEIPIVTSKSSNNLLQTQNIIQMENKNNIKTPIIAPVSMVSKRSGAPRSPSPKPEVQNEKKVPTPNSEAAKMTLTSAPITKAAVSSDTIVPKPNIQPQNHNVPKKIEPVSPPTTKMASGTSTRVPNISPKLTSPDVSTAASPIHTPSTANLVPPEQSFGTSSENKPTTKIEDSTLFPPSHKPLKTVGLTVTTATKEASLLRQVQSCPNSLQR